MYYVFWTGFAYIVICHDIFTDMDEKVPQVEVSIIDQCWDLYGNTCRIRVDLWQLDRVCLAREVGANRGIKQVIVFGQGTMRRRSHTRRLATSGPLKTRDNPLSTQLGNGFSRWRALFRLHKRDVRVQPDTLFGHSHLAHSPKWARYGHA